ncbi:MAG: hypothetical protein OIF48_06075 [Silicimonas sp.]|nr:hypothetical protein [Silicimonas sp.]
MSLLRLIKQTARDEKGSFSVEAILMFPMLAWAFMAMFVFFEGLRESNINLKAAYTVSDLLSRHQDPNDEFGMDDLNGMQAVYAWLSRTKNPVNLRVSFVTYDKETDFYKLQWSEAAHNAVARVQQEQVADALVPHIPILADGAGVIVVETWATYDPVIDMGLTQTELYNIVVIPPRFDGQLTWPGQGDGSGTVHDDGIDEDIDL